MYKWAHPDQKNRWTRHVTHPYIPERRLLMSANTQKRGRLVGRIAALAFLSLAVGFMLTEGQTKAAEADLSASEYITDIQIVSGDDSVESAIESGCKVMTDRIGGSMISYQTGSSAGSALKGLLLSKSGGESQSVDDISYKRLGSIGGYTLYGTTEGAAGGAIVALRMIDKPILGDGSHTVRDEQGEAVELEDGKYLTTIHAGQTGRYISALAKIKGNTENAAIRKAADQGFDYYKLIRDEGSIELIAYNRTNDEDKAVRGVYAVGEAEDYKVFYSVSPAAGAPVTDIELQEVSDVLWEGGSFPLGEWAKMTFGSGSGDAVSYIIRDDVYRELANSTDTYVWNPVSIYTDKAELGQALLDKTDGGSSLDIVVAQEEGQTGGDGDIELAGVDMEKFLSGTEEEAAEEENPEEMEEGDEIQDDEGEFGASETPVEAPSYEEVAEGDNDEEASADEGTSDGTEVEGEGEDASSTGSMVGSGKIIVILASLVLLAGILTGAIFFTRKRRNLLKGGADDGKDE